MTKQEEIFYVLQDVRLGELTEYEATLKLQELGVVLKVERKLPVDNPFNQDKRGDEWTAYELGIIAKAGYVAVEPLIKEVRYD